MCSVTDFDTAPNEITTTKFDKKIDLICKKCSTEKAAVVLQKKHSYCRACFLSMISHKFRSTIGKNKLVRPDDKVLNVFTGNQSSVALLHLIRRGMDVDTRKKIRFRPTILFIDESVLWPRDIDVHSFIPEVFATLKNFGFPCYVTKLSSIYDDQSTVNIEDIEVAEYLSQNECDVKLISLFEGIATATSKIALLLELRSRVQYKIAKLLDCDKIFTPECGTDLSIRLLSDVALGRGSQASNDVAVCDEKNPFVRCIRPLREITSKEIAFYNLFSGIESPNVPSPFVMFDSHPSLQSETESFIYGLQEEFSSTVYTIFHVGDKLKASEIMTDAGISCSLCGHLFVPQLRTSKHFQPKLCSPNAVNVDSNVHEDEKTDENTSEMNQIFTENLCYACQLITKDLGSPNHLPGSLIREASSQSQSEVLRKRIEDCLL